MAVRSAALARARRLPRRAPRPRLIVAGGASAPAPRRTFRPNVSAERFGVVGEAFGLIRASGEQTCRHAPRATCAAQPPRDPGCWTASARSVAPPVCSCAVPAPHFPKSPRVGAITAIVLPGCRQRMYCQSSNAAGCMRSPRLRSPRGRRQRLDHLTQLCELAIDHFNLVCLRSILLILRF